MKVRFSNVGDTEKDKITKKCCVCGYRNRNIKGREKMS